MGITSRTATEASAVAAIVVAVTFAFSGAWIPAGISAIIGIALFAAYEYLGMEDISFTEDEIKRMVKDAEDIGEHAADGEYGKAIDDTSDAVDEQLE